MQHAVCVTEPEKRLFAELIVQGMRVSGGTRLKGITFSFSHTGDLKGSRQDFCDVFDSRYGLVEKIYALCGLTKNDVCLYTEQEIREKLHDPGQFGVDLTWVIEGFFLYLHELNLEGGHAFLSATSSSGFVVPKHFGPLFDAFADCGYAQKIGDVFAWSDRIVPHLAVYRRPRSGRFEWVFDRHIDKMIDTMPPDLRAQLEQIKAAHDENQKTRWYFTKFIENHWYRDQWNEDPVLASSDLFNGETETSEAWGRAISRRLGLRDLFP
ncbi:MAG: hypothetical protein ACRBCL_02650 [Maritimibacter sp.]